MKEIRSVVVHKKDAGLSSTLVHQHVSPVVSGLQKKDKIGHRWSEGQMRHKSVEKAQPITTYKKSHLGPQSTSLFIFSSSLASSRIVKSTRRGYYSSSKYLSNRVLVIMSTPFNKTTLKELVEGTEPLPRQHESLAGLAGVRPGSISEGSLFANRS